MTGFTEVRKAKEFLIGRILLEAQLEGVPVSELERKMMYFSESGWTLPDMEAVNETFSDEYDMMEYEQKIGSLVRHYLGRVRKADREQFKAWQEAVEVLKEEDHYLLVLIQAPTGESALPPSSRMLQLVAMGAALGCLVLGIWALVILMRR
jgi:hypothetical protein